MYQRQGWETHLRYSSQSYYKMRNGTLNQIWKPIQGVKDILPPSLALTTDEACE